MKILTDYHHDDLLYSLHLLFEKRLQMELYRPIGKDWFEQGYWKIAEPYGNPPATIAQFLVVGAPSPDDTKPLNTDPHYADGEPHKLITLDEFMETEFDIAIASYLPHVPVFAELLTKHKSRPKLVHQMGNNWSKLVDYSQVKNLMVSCASFEVPPGTNAVFYHQEFDTNTFKFEPYDWARPKQITSFVNVLKDFKDDIKYIRKLQKELGDYQFKLYGSLNDDGPLYGHTNIAKEMQNSIFGLHLKAGGDGFGHVIHNWFACGRPPIVKYSYYKGQLAGELMKDGETCIFVDGLALKDVVKKVEYYSDDVRYEAMSKKAFQVFKERVDFDKEEKSIRKFLDMLR